MQEDALHVLVIVRVAVAVVVISVIVRMPVTMVCMTESCEAYNVYEEAQNTDNQKFIEPLEFVTFPKSFKGIKDDLYADKSGMGQTYARNIWLTTYKRKTPLANPDRVSILP